MEHHSSKIISSLPFLLFSLSFILFISQIRKLVVKNSETKSKETNKLISKIPPPGPWKLPIIGSMHHLVGRSLPHHRLRELSQKYGPLMHLKLGEVSTVVVSSAEFAQEILKTNDAIFAERPHQLGADIICYGSTDVATARYGGYWKQLRRICASELLGPTRVRSFGSIREEEVMNLIRYVNVCANDGCFVNLSERVASMMSAITSRAAFGEKCKHEQEFGSCIKKLMKLAEGYAVFDLFPSHKWLYLVSGMKGKLEEVHGTFDEILEDIIRGATRKIDGEVESLLSVLLRIKDDGTLHYPLTINNIKAVIFDLFGAGVDTSSAVIEWTISELLMNPTTMKKAQEEVRKVFGIKGYTNESSLKNLTYLKATIKETLRLHPPFPLLLPKECRETCHTKGYTIVAGTKVLVNAFAIGRDPKYWTEAERFCPERFLERPDVDYKGSNFEFIPFGAGRRMCPGISFGVSSIELCLAMLLFYFNWEIPKGDKGRLLEMGEALGTSARRKTHLLLRPVAYNPMPLL